MDVQFPLAWVHQPAGLIIIISFAPRSSELIVIAVVSTSLEAFGVY